MKPDSASSHSDWLYQPEMVEAPQGHWIGGRPLLKGGASFEVRRPSDGRVHAAIAQATPETVDAAVLAAREGQRAWAVMLPRKRGVLMRRWAELVERDTVALARLESVVSSRPFAEAVSADVPAVAEWIRFYGEYADKLEGTVTSAGADKLSLVLREPYGVVGIITPWNFPLFLTTWKVAPALAAGNAVIIKPSELTPFSVRALAELASEAGIPDGVVNVVQGTGPAVGSSLVRHPEVSYVTFTGSTAVGARIMQDAAAPRIKPVSLELGGKSPTVVFADCGELDGIADHVAWGITRNAGQLCYAGARLVVADDIADDLLGRVQARMTCLSMGPTWRSGTTLPPIISARQCDRIGDLVGRTVAEGARLICGGRGTELGGGRFYAATILDNVTPDMTGYRQEIFGPVLCVQRFRSEDEAFALAAHPDYGLSASVFTRDVGRAIRAGRSIQAGSVWINRWGRTPEMMTSPFGGYGQSGIGKESGRMGLEGFLRAKSVWFDASGHAELSQGGSR